MNEKTLKSILTVLVALVVLWGISAGVGAMRSGGGASSASGVAAALEGLDATSVSTITVTPPDAPAILVSRSGDAWTANGYPADTAQLTRVWQALGELEVGDVVATNPANHARMGVSSDSAWSVQFGGAQRSTTVLVGKSGRSFNSAYLRLPNEDEVVLAQGGLRSALTRAEDDWKDKTIVRVDTAMVTRVVVERMDERMTFERGDSTWTVSGEPARTAAVSNLLRELDRLTASGFLAQGDSVFRGNEQHLRVEDQAGTVLAEISFLGDGATRHARVAGVGTVFEIPSWRVDRVAPTEELAKEADPGG